MLPTSHDTAPLLNEKRGVCIPEDVKDLRLDLVSAWWSSGSWVSLRFLTDTDFLDWIDYLLYFITELTFHRVTLIVNHYYLNFCASCFIIIFPLL